MVEQIRSGTIVNLSQGRTKVARGQSAVLKEIMGPVLARSWTPWYSGSIMGAANI